ncbi:DUF6496 domain-containing protein [uncultured Bradyrhizobium sp.]|uniref:DUF6496 domain-containing protein n=1 Tax=uncultured Bradyrhizobium sp. TaxID=199684 RepID=UPI0035CCA18D
MIPSLPLFSFCEGQNGSRSCHGGESGKVKRRKQVMAISQSKARKTGEKVPKKKK